MSTVTGYIQCEEVHRNIKTGVLGLRPLMAETVLEWKDGDTAEVSDELWPWFKRQWQDGCFWPWELEYLGTVVGEVFRDAKGKVIEGTGTRHIVRRIGGAE